MEIFAHAKQHYEFGAGWDLMIPLMFYTLGAKRQILVDVRYLVRPALVNHTIGQLQRLQAELGLPRATTKFLPAGQDFLPALSAYYGIEYRARQGAM